MHLATPGPPAKQIPNAAGHSRPTCQADPQCVWPLQAWCLQLPGPASKAIAQADGHCLHRSPVELATPRLHSPSGLPMELATVPGQTPRAQGIYQWKRPHYPTGFRMATPRPHPPCWNWLCQGHCPSRPPRELTTPGPLLEETSCGTGHSKAPLPKKSPNGTGHSKANP